MQPVAAGRGSAPSPLASAKWFDKSDRSALSCHCRLPALGEAQGGGGDAVHPTFIAEEPETMLLVEVRRLDVAPNTDQFWTLVSRINGPEFMGVLYRAREAIFDSAGISFTLDLLNKFLQFDVTKSWSASDEGELFMGSAPVVGWLRVRRPGSATLRELRSDDVHFMELEHAAKPAFVEVGVAYRAGTEKVRTDFLKRIRTAAQEALGQEVGTPSSWPVLAPVGSHNFDAIRKSRQPTYKATAEENQALAAFISPAILD